MVTDVTPEGSVAVADTVALVGGGGRVVHDARPPTVAENHAGTSPIAPITGGAVSTGGGGVVLVAVVVVVRRVVVVVGGAVVVVAVVVATTTTPGTGVLV